MKKIGIILLIILISLLTACSSAKSSRKTKTWGIARSKRITNKRIGPVAYITEFSGEIKITRNGRIIIPRKNQTLLVRTFIRVAEDALLTLMMFSGQKVSFVNKAYFKLVAGGIQGLNRQTIAFLKEKNPDIDRSDPAASR